MTMHRQIGIRSLSLATIVGLGLVAAPAAQAQWNGRQQNGVRQVFEWQGRVDKETRLYVGRTGAHAQGVYGRESGGRFVSRGTLPSGSGTLYVQRLSGRGTVDVIQQPYNGDGIIRIADKQGGADYYDVRVFWQPSGSTTVGRNGNGGWDRNGNGGWDHNGGYDQNDGYDRSDDRGANGNGNGRGHAYGHRKHRHGNDRDDDRYDRYDYYDR
jgi:hypothetical protein